DDAPLPTSITALAGPKAVVSISRSDAAGCASYQPTSVVDRVA
ncbi:MAG: hypothetical protein QOI08_70, partial [Actinomycetota bacterium]|nr:hypothetical protein [Actinomycetota bacterium]